MKTKPAPPTTAHERCIRWAALAMTVPVTALAGCAAGAGTGSATVPDRQEPGKTLRRTVPGPTEADNSAATGSFARRSAMAAQAGLLYTRSVHVDPVSRPVSNFLSLSSHALRSATGLLRRTALGTVQFPALERERIPPLSNGISMDLAQWEHDLDRISGRKQSIGNIEFLIDGESYFRRLRQAFDDAEESIDIRTYIFDNDDFAVEVADQLKTRSRDVDVRILVDALGSMVAMQEDAASMPADFRVPLSIGQYLERDSAVKFRSRANPWLTSDHTKTTIIDRRLAFVGGMNIGREYRYDWHDLMLEVTGPVVDQLQYDNNKAWARSSVFGDLANFFAFLSGIKRDAGRNGYPVRVLYTRHHDSQIYRSQLEAIRRSKRYILIENAYFSDDVTLFELARARRRGVDVRVILPAEPNHASHAASNRVAINRMLRNGIRVYLYPGMTHVKAAIFDGWACVGSANFDKLSLQVNRELNLATSHKPAVDKLLDQLFIPDLARSTEVTELQDLTLQARFLEFVVDETM